jgi:outer membrane protein TolC
MMMRTMMRSSAAAILAWLLFSPPASLLAQQPGEPLQLTLDAAIEMALDQGNSARAADAARTAAMHRDDAFYARLLPQLALNGEVPTYNRSIIPVVQPDGTTLFRPQDQTSVALEAQLSQAVPFTGGEVFVASSLERIAISGTSDAITWSSTPISIGIRQPIFRPNTIGWDRREQPMRSEVANRQFLEAREQIALETTGLFFGVYAARASLENATANAATNDTLYTLNTGRYQIGTIGENDLLQSELALLRAQTDVDGATLALERALATLRLALHLDPSQPVELVIPTEIPQFDADSARAASEALRNRSVVTSLELQEVQAERNVASARMNNGWGATVQASLGFNATGNNFNRAYTELLERRGLTVQVEMPMIQWGARSATIDAAKADREELANTTELTLNQTALEARFAAVQLSQARRNLSLSARADTVAQKRFEVAYNRYVIGRISVDNLFIAQREKDQARAQYVQALGGFWEAYYRLRLITLFDFQRGERIHE